MKYFFLILVILLCAPAGALSCSNVKIQASGASLNDKIICDNITAFETSPELQFLNISQTGNSVVITGNISGVNTTGYIRIFGDDIHGSQIDIKTAMRIPVVINAGSTVIPTQNTHAPIMQAPITDIPTPIQTSGQMIPIKTVIIIIVGIVAAMFTGVIIWDEYRGKKK